MEYFPNTTTASSIMLLEQTTQTDNNNNISGVPDLNPDRNTDLDPADSGPEPWVYLSEETMFYFRAVNWAINFIVNITGVGTNILNIVVFWRVGFKESTVNLSLFALAISDFGACFTLIMMSITMQPWFRQFDLPFNPDELSLILSAWPRVVFTKITILITAFITFERCLCVAMPLSVKTLFTPLRVKAVLVLCYASIIAVTAPVFYVNRLAPKFYPERNRTMVGIIFTEEKKACG